MKTLTAAEPERSLQAGPGELRMPDLRACWREKADTARREAMEHPALSAGAGKAGAAGAPQQPHSALAAPVAAAAGEDAGHVRSWPVARADRPPPARAFGRKGTARRTFWPSALPPQDAPGVCLGPGADLSAAARIQLQHAGAGAAMGQTAAAPAQAPQTAIAL